jgi:hypothetical protein
MEGVKEQALRMLDEVIRGRRGTSIFREDGELTNIGTLWKQEIEKVGDPELAWKAVAALFTDTPADRIPTITDYRGFVREFRRAAERDRETEATALDPGPLESRPIETFACATCEDEGMVEVAFRRDKIVRRDPATGRHVYGGETGMIAEMGPCPYCEKGRRIEFPEDRVGPWGSAGYWQGRDPGEVVPRKTGGERATVGLPDWVRGKYLARYVHDDERVFAAEVPYHEQSWLDRYGVMPAEDEAEWIRKAKEAGIGDDTIYDTFDPGGERVRSKQRVLALRKATEPLPGDEDNPKLAARMAELRDMLKDDDGD